MTRGLLVLLLILVAETLHGILRGLFLVPWLGESLSGRIGWPVAALLVLAISYALIGWTRLNTAANLLALGAVWAALTFVFEVGIGLLRGFDVQRIIAEINPLSGGLLLYSLAVMLAAPLVVAWLRGLLRPAQP